MALQKVVTDDKNIQLIQSNVEAALKPLQSQPMTGGVFLTGISLIAGQANNIQHGLNRVPQIYFVGNLDTNTTVWKTAASSSTITLWCGSNCTVSLWIN